MMPLWTTCTGPAVCGWAFAVVAAPWVAHRVCPIPVDPGAGFSETTLISSESLPTALRRMAVPRCRVVSPALS